MCDIDESKQVTLGEGPGSDEAVGVQLGGFPMKPPAPQRVHEEPSGLPAASGFMSPTFKSQSLSLCCSNKHACHTSK